MAWRQSSEWGGESGDRTVWINDQTGEKSYTQPMEASGQLGYTAGGYSGDAEANAGFYDTGSQAAYTGADASTRYVKQLDDAFNSVWNNPNASWFEKAQAIENRYGIQTLAQNAGMFTPEQQAQLGPYIQQRQDSQAQAGFTAGGNPLGLWPVVGGMLAGSLLGGTVGGGAAAASGEGAAGAGATGAGTVGGVSSAGFDAAALGAGGAGAAPGLTASSGAALGAGGASAAPGLAATGAAGTSLAPGFFASEAALAGGLGGAAAGGTALSGAGSGTAATGGGASGAAAGGGAAGATGAASTGGVLSSLLSNSSLIGGLAGAGLGALSGSGTQSNTIQTEEGIPDWLMPYVKPQLDQYASQMQNYQTDPYGIMPSAMKEFQNTVSGMYLDPSTNKYLEDYFRLGSERIRSSLSPSFGHMQAFGQHSGYNEALSRGLGDYAVGLYGGAYEKERDRQNQLTAAAPAFLGQSTQQQFQPFSQYLSSVGSLGKSKETPYFTNPYSSILGGAMFGSQFGKAFG